MFSELIDLCIDNTLGGSYYKDGKECLLPQSGKNLRKHNTQLGQWVLRIPDIHFTQYRTDAFQLFASRVDFMGLMLVINGAHSFLTIRFLFAFVLFFSNWPSSVHAVVERRITLSSSQIYYVTTEFLDDDLIHVEIAEVTNVLPTKDAPLNTTPMIRLRDWPGPVHFEEISEGQFETAELKIHIEKSSLCITVWDKARGGATLTSICPENLGQTQKQITLSKESVTHVYGLGQMFRPPTDQKNSHLDRTWTTGDSVHNPADDFGNAMVWNDEIGASGGTQIPIMFALGPGMLNYGFFLDNIYKHNWNFNGDVWHLKLYGGQIAFYLLSGQDLIDVVKDYGELVGTAAIPPKKMFGLWMSEFANDSWEKLKLKLNEIRKAAFPIDGLSIDLAWFGGVVKDSEDSPMGRLKFDDQQFPNAQSNIKSLSDEGIALMLIEESYVARGIPEHATLANLGYLAKNCDTNDPIFLAENAWWGRGGMIDWTNDAAADFWHDEKRRPLIEMGILGHWLDLGEPEMFSSEGCYYGFPERGKHRHADIHNIYNFKWAESIMRGYQRAGSIRRPFMLSRSGAAGLQRFGAVLWSGDLLGRLPALASHLNAQLHTSLSGISYYSSDIGGFHRVMPTGGSTCDCQRSDDEKKKEGEMYTQWFANSMMFDVPARVHTYNMCGCFEISPNKIGDASSNLENLRLRYEFFPYLYSLAYELYRYGTPIFPPLVYLFQNDISAREIGHEKMIGPSLLAAVVARHGETKRDIYLPKGIWTDYYSHESYQSEGNWIPDIPVYRADHLRLPLFARAGAIIPKLFIDEQSMNLEGMRRDGSRRDDLIIRIYAAEQKSSFVLYEDDGVTTEYQRGSYRTTLVSQEKQGKKVLIKVGGSHGSYANAPTQRPISLELIFQGAQAASVDFQGIDLKKHDTKSDWDSADAGYLNSSKKIILIKTKPTEIDQDKTFIVSLG